MSLLLQVSKPLFLSEPTSILRTCSSLKCSQYAMKMELGNVVSMRALTMPVWGAPKRFNVAVRGVHPSGAYSCAVPQQPSKLESYFTEHQRS